MARSESGGRFRGLLEFIGVVPGREDREEEILRDTRSANTYGRGTTYDPRVRGTAVNRTSTSPRADTHVPNYTGSRPRSRTGSLADDTGYRSGSARRERDYGRTSPNPAGNRENRAARFTEQGAARAADARRNVPAVRDNRPQRMVMLSMQQLEDCCEVIDHLIAGSMVLITLDDMDVKLNQRVIDTLSGSVYALKAKIRKASEKTYLVAPGNVDIDDAEYVTRTY